MGTLEQIRDIVKSQMELTSDIISGIVDSGSASTLVDSALITTLLPTDTLDGAWVYIDDTTDDAAPEGESARVQKFDRTNGTLTLKPDLSAAVAASDTYELHRSFNPLRIDEMINLALRLGTKGALGSLSGQETAQTALTDDTVAEGAMHFLRLAQARRLAGSEKQRVHAEAADHLNNFRQMCLDEGYDIWYGRRVAREKRLSEVELDRRA